MPPPLQIDAADMPPRDRAEAIRDAIWRLIVRVEIEHQESPEAIAAHCRLRSLGQLRLCSVQSNAHTIQRTRSLAKDDLEPSIFLGLQISGTSMVVQDGREAVLRPGEMALYDTTRPYTLVNDGGIDQHYFRLPRTALALPARAIDDAIGVTFGQDHPLAAITSSYLTDIAAQPDLPSGQAEAIAIPTLELVRALIATRTGATRLAEDAMANTAAVRVLEYVRLHLADPTLTPERIAADHHMSVRSLYTLMAAAEISLAGWIRERRLEACRIELTRPNLHDQTIASIASRWGFVDPTHFSRAFRARYGLSPREWRHHRTRP
jgi:AraC-like DNA-binding protein